VPIHDFDQVVYRIRPIDQQCYEGNFKIYRPQFFKENYPMVKLVKDKLQDSSIEHIKMKNELYWLKEFFRQKRIKRLLKIMGNDLIALMSMFKG
jgi:hypothetical protein